MKALKAQENVKDFGRKSKERSTRSQHFGSKEKDAFLEAKEIIRF